MSQWRRRLTDAARDAIISLFGEMTKSTIRDVVAVAAGLADESRLRTLLALRSGELCLCQITELLKLAPSTVSKHLAILKSAGLVESRKRGRWMLFCLPGRARTTTAARAALDWLGAVVSADPALAADARELRRIRRIDPKQLCRLQNTRRKCCSSARATPAAARWPKASPARFVAV